MLLLLMILVLPSLSVLPTTHLNAGNDNRQVDQYANNDTDKSKLSVPEVNQFTLSQAMSEYSGTGDYLSVYEYGDRTDFFESTKMRYIPGSGTTSATDSVPLGSNWEAYKLFANISQITENRTWVQNPGFDDTSNWVFDHVDLQPYTDGDGNPHYVNSFIHQVDSGVASFGIDGEYTSYSYDGSGGGRSWYWYDAGDHAYAQQSLTIDRGDVLWAAFSLDYKVSTAWDRYGYSPTGFFEIYVTIISNGVRYKVWSKVYDGIPSENWYSTGLVEVSPDIFTLPNIAIEIGLNTTQTEWYGSIDISPRASFDNVNLYLKTEAKPSNLNLKMNNIDVNDVQSGGNTLWGRGEVTQIPTTPWTGSSVDAVFSWTPIPNPPDPDMTIIVEMDVTLTLYARRLNGKTIYDIDPSALGEHFSVSNGSPVNWNFYYYVAVPSGYDPHFFFNITIPQNRDINFLAEPSKPWLNQSSGWSYGDPGDGLVNISAAEIIYNEYGTTFQRINGYWKLKGTSPNMISNVEVRIPGSTSYTKTYNFRANDKTVIRAYLGTAYTNSIVNFTIYDPSGNLWYSCTSTVDASGYAYSDQVTLGGTNATVGEWTIQVWANDSALGSLSNAGFFLRKFTITHATDITLYYPLSAQSTWTTRVTYGDNILVKIRIQDVDAGQSVPGGVMTYNWTTGIENLNDLGTGEYSVVLNTTQLGQNGRFVLNILWSKSYYDSKQHYFYLEVYYDSQLTSPSSPGISVPKTAYGDIYVDFVDQNNNGITGATITCNWSDYSVIATGTPGSYRIHINAEPYDLGTYKIEINASKDYVYSKKIVLQVTVRELYTSATPSASFLTLPVGGYVDLNITYHDTDQDLPMIGDSDAFSTDWCSFHTSGQLNYTVFDNGNGIYTIRFYSYNEDPLGSYTVQINIEKYGYQNHTLTIHIDIKTHLTSFSLDDPVNPTPYTGTIVVTVYYYDASMNEGIANDTANGHNVWIYLVASGITLEYSVTNATTGQGHYNITLAADQWGSIGWKEFTVYVNWTGPSLKYSNKTIDIKVRITGSETMIKIIESPDAVQYMTNTSWKLSYWDTANSTGIANATGPYAGNVHLYITMLTSGETVTQSDFWVNETSPGYYEFKLDTSKLSRIGEFSVRIQFNWTKGQLPLYENQTIEIIFRVLQRQTYIDWTPIPTTPYNELVNFSFKVVDLLSGNHINYSSHMYVSIVENGIIYTIYYDGNDTGMFHFEINTTSWDNPGTFVFHLNVTMVGWPFYQNHTYQEITIQVRYRHTQLTHGSYEPVQFANVLTLSFTYTDLDSGQTAGMSGTLELNASLAGYYTYTFNGDGSFTLYLNSSGFQNLGTFAVVATVHYNGSNYCDDAVDTFYVVVVQRRAQLGYEIPDPAPYLEFANISVRYYDDSTGRGIYGATITSNCSTSNEALQLNVNYFVFYQGNGWYLISINTTALGDLGTYDINIFASYSGSPYYTSNSRTVQVVVTLRNAKLTIVKTPVDTPFMNNVTFQFSFRDSITDNGIDITKANIILTHGTSNILIYSNQYVLTGGSGLYTISLNSTILTSVLVSGHIINITIVWGNIAPYYDNISVTTEVSIVERPTRLVFSQVPSVAYGNNITITIRYEDFYTTAGISNANTSLICLNATGSFSYSVVYLGDGYYSFIVNSSQLPSLGKYWFSVNFTYSPSPYYQDQLNSHVSATLRPISTLLQVSVPMPGTVPVGDNVIANVTFWNIDSDIGIEGANITVNWQQLYGTSITITELGNGVYQLNISTTGLDAKVYSFNVWASKPTHLNKTSTVDIELAPIPTSIELKKSVISVVWTESVTIVLTVWDTHNNMVLTGFDLQADWVGNTYTNFTSYGNGTYSLTFGTGVNPVGTYIITITGNKTNYRSPVAQVTLTVTKVSTSLSSDVLTFEGVDQETIHFWVFYNDTYFGHPIEGATVTFEWEFGSGTLVSNGTAGFYEGNLTINQYPVGTYTIYVSAKKDNYAESSVFMTLTIASVPTAIKMMNGIQIIDCYHGQIVNITVYVYNTKLNIPVLNATVMYSSTFASGNMTELGGGWYFAIINSSKAEIGSFYISITAQKTGYRSAFIRPTLNVLSIPTEIIAINPVVEEYYGRNVTFNVYFNDTLNNKLILAANGTYRWIIGSGMVYSYGNGTFYITLNTGVARPGQYSITILLEAKYHDTARKSVILKIKEIPTSVILPENLVYPVGDPFNLRFTYMDTLNNVGIPNASVSLIWTFSIVELKDLHNGTYVFSSSSFEDQFKLEPNNYTLTLVFSKVNYSIKQEEVVLSIILIPTEIKVSVKEVYFSPGDLFTLRLVYYDTYHNRTIPNAIIDVDTSSDRIHFEGNVIDYGNGTYAMNFTINDIGTFYISIKAHKQDYEVSTIQIIVYSQYNEQQMAFFNMLSYGFVGIFILVIIGALWVKVFSIPKPVRRINKLVKALEKGKIPALIPAPSRHEILLSMINSLLAPLDISKSPEDVIEYPISIKVPELSALLDELASITGLSEEDIEEFKEDLYKMRASERIGFVKEVIEQERARRAKALAEGKITEMPKAPEEKPEHLTEEEIEELRKKLKEKGVSDSEIELIIEQAKELSRADLDALLDTIFRG